MKVTNSACFTPVLEDVFVALAVKLLHKRVSTLAIQQRLDNKIDNVAKAAQS